MEEYRRKYLTPSYRQSATIDLHRSSTISDLRQQLHECKDMETKFDDLCLEIVKVERQNRQIQGEKVHLQEQYMEKIKTNKAKIESTKKEVELFRESIDEKMKKVGLIDQENDRLKGEVARIEVQRSKNQLELQDVKEKLVVKEGLVREIQGRIEDCRGKAAGLNARCQEKSKELNKEYNELKKNQAKLKEEEESNQELKKKLSSLAKQRQSWEKQVQANEAGLNSLKDEYAICKNQEAAKELECLSLEKQNRKKEDDFMRSRSDCKKVMMENGQLASKLKGGQAGVFTSLANLSKSREYLEKMSLKEIELRKDNERLTELASQLSQTLVEEQQSYNRVIGHMRQSIQQDEQAIESLVRQATTLQTMIS